MSLKSRNSKNPELDWSNLPQNSYFGQEFVQKSGVQIPVREGQFFLSLFLFIFKFSTKKWLSLFLTIFKYLFLLIRNQIKHIENIWFYWYLICKTRYEKMIKDNDMQFCMKNLKMKRKKDKKIWPSLTGIWTPDFWTNSRQKFEFWGRWDQWSSGFLELLYFTYHRGLYVW